MARHSAGRALQVDDPQKGPLQDFFKVELIRVRHSDLTGLAPDRLDDSTFSAI